MLFQSHQDYYHAALPSLRLPYWATLRVNGQTGCDLELLISLLCYVVIPFPSFNNISLNFFIISHGTEQIIGPCVSEYLARVNVDRADPA